MAWRVVIGYDGSEAGEDAVAFGLTWCRSTGDVPVVATVYPEEHPLGAGQVDAEWAAYVRKLGQETLDKAQAAAGDAAIYRLVASSSAARGLADLAEDIEAAAVLVGGSRKDGAGGGRLGSVANRLLYGATVPVCVVPEAWQAPDSGVISKIGVAFVDTKDGHEALRSAVRAANRIPARLVLYSVSARSTEHYSYIAGRRDEQVFYDAARASYTQALDYAVAGVPPSARAGGSPARGRRGRAAGSTGARRCGHAGLRVPWLWSDPAGAAWWRLGTPGPTLTTPGHGRTTGLGGFLSKGRLNTAVRSCVVGGLVFLVANRLELEGAVRDVEVPTEAFAEPVQHLTGAALADAGLVHDDMRGQHGYTAGDRPGVQVVDIDHSAYPHDVVSYVGKVHTAGGGFQ